MNIQKKLLKLLVVTLLSMLLVSCVTTKRTNYLQDPGGRIPSYTQTDSIPEYHLQKGDELSIIIFSLEEEANAVFNQGIASQYAVSANSRNERNIYSYTIYDDGCINYPVVGKVLVEGKTLREVSVSIKEKLKGQFIINEFSVTVSLVNNNFSLITDKGSGRYPITSTDMNIFQAIASSQDLAEYADRGQVKIIRQVPTGTIIKEFDIRSKDILNSEFYYVQPNDVIYVQSYDGQFFRLNSFGTILSTIMTTITFGLFVWAVTGL